MAEPHQSTIRPPAEFDEQVQYPPFTKQWDNERTGEHHHGPYEHQLPPVTEFFAVYPLISNTLKGETIRKYGAAYERFRLSHASLTTLDPTAVDKLLALYINQTYLSDPSPRARTECSYLLSMLYIAASQLKPHLNLSRRSIVGWSRTTKRHPSTPLSPQMAYAFARHLLNDGSCDSACILLLSFAGFLRASEALNLTWADVTLPGDCRLAGYPPHTCGLNVVDAKTATEVGERQFVAIHCARTAKLLRAISRGQKPGHLISNLLSYSTYLRDIKRAAAHYGFQDAKFTPHSARVGAATHAFISGVSVDDIAVRGRWRSVSSVRYYVTNGRAWLASTRIKPTDSTRLEADATDLASKLDQA